jgi:hypothetical protein
VHDIKSGANVPGFHPHEVVLMTSNTTIAIPNDISRFIQVGDKVENHRSTWFGISKGILVKSYYWINPDNVFTAQGFFLKVILTSLFVWVFARPKYWMVALMGINMVTLLVISGLPAHWIAGLAFSVAFLFFLFSAARR